VFPETAHSLKVPKCFGGTIAEPRIVTATALRKRAREADANGADISFIVSLLIGSSTVLAQADWDWQGCNDGRDPVAAI